MLCELDARHALRKAHSALIFRATSRSARSRASMDEARIRRARCALSDARFARSGARCRRQASQPLAPASPKENPRGRHPAYRHARDSRRAPAPARASQRRRACRSRSRGRHESEAGSSAWDLQGFHCMEGVNGHMTRWRRILSVVRRNGDRAGTGTRRADRLVSTLCRYRTLDVHAIAACRISPRSAAKRAARSRERHEERWPVSSAAPNR